TGSVATKSELSIAQMVQAVKDQYKEIKEIGDNSDPLLPRELDAQNMDPDHVDALTRIVQADKDECELLSEINRRIRISSEMFDGSQAEGQGLDNIRG
ncbi:hypothetical protein KCU78_g10822, partial [Aureobasidium melanogenum]